MEKFLITENIDLQEVANAIKEKLGKTEKINILEMPSLIRSISGSGNGNGSFLPADTSPIVINPRVVCEYHGALTNMNTNEAYPSTEYYGTRFTGVELTYGKNYLVELNDNQYFLTPGFTPLLALAGTGYGGMMGSNPTGFLTLGNTNLLDEFLARQQAEPPEEGEEDTLGALGPLLMIIMALIFGGTVDIEGMKEQSEYPFTFVDFGEFAEESEDVDFDTLFIVNTGIEECDLKITEYNIDIAHPVNTYLQADYLQLNNEHPGYIKNKLIGVESTNKLFFDGKIEDLTLTPLTDDEGETVGYSAPLNDLPAGLILWGTIFGAALANQASDTDMFGLMFANHAIIVTMNGAEQILYPLNLSMFEDFAKQYENMTEEEKADFEAQFKAFFGEEGNINYPFGNLSILNKNLPNTGENFCVTVSFKDNSASTENAAEGDSAIEEDTDTEESINMWEAMDSMYSYTATIYTNLTDALPAHTVKVEFADLKILEKKFLPAIVENDLPSTALTYTRSSENLMIKDGTNGFEYLILCNNGTISTLARCASIQVLTNPNKMTYKKGEYFDPTGMVVQATRQDGTTEIITDKVTCSNTDSAFSSTGTDKAVTISFYEAGHIYSTEIKVTVNS